MNLLTKGIVFFIHTAASLKKIEIKQRRSAWKKEVISMT
jgi:hypothetical protein